MIILRKSVNFNLYTKEMMAHGFLHLIGYDHNNKKSFNNDKTIRSNFMSSKNNIKI